MASNASDPAAKDGAGDVSLATNAPAFTAKPGFKQPISGSPGGVTYRRIIAAFPAHFNERELAFVEDMACRPSEPSPRQFDWLNNLVARVESRLSL